MVDFGLSDTHLPDRAERAFAELASQQIDLVDLVFSDISGGAKTLTIPSALLDDALLSGYRFDGSAVMGGTRQMELDLANPSVSRKIETDFRTEQEDLTHFLRRLSAPLLMISNHGDVVSQVRRLLGVPGMPS